MIHSPIVNRPKVGVGVVVFRGDSVLCIQRGRPPGQGVWSIPGGHQEWGETLFEAATREMREETGLTVRPGSIITAVDVIGRNDDGTIDHHYTIIDILAVDLGGEPIAGDDAAAVAWVPMARLDDVVGWAVTRNVIRQAWMMSGSPAMPG